MPAVPVGDPGDHGTRRSDVAANASVNSGDPITVGGATGDW